MAAFLSTLLAGSALLNVVNAQDFGGSGREEDAFSYVVSSSWYKRFAMFFQQILYLPFLDSLC
jgi:hypothetical protein